jgi:hypothetical protein
MAFRKIIGGQEFEIEPVPPFTEEQVKKLIDDGQTANEHYPRQVIKDRKTDEVYAEFKMV